MRFRHLTILIFTLCWFSESAAQEILQVAEKSIARTIKAEPGDELEIHTEKAEVIITTADIDDVEVKILFTSSHRDKQVAAKELIYHKYAMGRDGKTIFVRTTYFLRDVKKVFSKMSAKVEIVIPRNMNVKANGEYCDFSLTDSRGTGEFFLHFGKLILNNVSGHVKVDTNYGDIEINQCTGFIDVVSKRSDILLRTTTPISSSQITPGVEQVLEVRNFKIHNTSGKIRIENPEP